MTQSDYANDQDTFSWVGSISKEQKALIVEPRVSKFAKRIKIIDNDPVPTFRFSNKFARIERIDL